MPNFNFQMLNTKLWIILLSAILLKIFLALSTFHPDIRAFNLAGDLVRSGNILNLYDFLGSCTPDNPLLKTFGVDLFIYPPLIYLLHGVFNLVFSLVFGNQLMNGFIIDQVHFFGNWWFNLHLLLLKVPYLLFDIPAAFLIAALFESKKDRLWAFCLWLFNPIILYSAYMMGQFDVIPASLTILSLFLIKRKKIYFAALALGVAAAFKLYPLFLVVPFVLAVPRWRDRAVLGLLAVIPYVMSIIPYLPSEGFRSSALVAGLTQKTLFAQIPVSGGSSLLLFPLIVFLMYLYFWYREQSVERIWQRWFVVLLAFFSLTHFHPQWLSWLAPFLVMELVIFRRKNLFLHLMLLLSYTGMIFLFDPSLSVKIFAPLVPSLYLLPGTWEGFGVNIDFNYYRSLLQTGFAGVSVFFIYLYFSQRFNNK